MNFVKFLRTPFFTEQNMSGAASNYNKNLNLAYLKKMKLRSYEASKLCSAKWTLAHKLLKTPKETASLIF